MNTPNTALAVLEWALAPNGPPPRNHALNLAELAAPQHGPALDALTARLLNRDAAAAQLVATQPEPGGFAPLLAAAAVALRDTETLSEHLLALAETLTLSLADQLLIAELLGQARGHLDEALGDGLTRLCPLAGLLWQPSAGGQAAARALARRLLARPAGQTYLCHALARPAAVPAVLHWRADLMARWRLGDAAQTRFVVDLYACALQWHRPALLAVCQRAAAVLQRPIGATAAQIELALAWAAWFTPLWHLQRARPELLRKNRQVDYAYLSCLRLVHTVQALPGGLPCHAHP